MNPTKPLLEVHDLKMHFPIYGGVFRRQVGRVHAVDGISLAIGEGETLGLVGESGCGKTTAGRSILRLYQPIAGKIVFDGKDVLRMGREELRQLRREVQMIFQDPFESLNSRHTVGDILLEPFAIHHIGSPEERIDRVKTILARVGMSERSLDKFPHEFSGGQRQRIGIARAIALNPKLIVCDEPVSALDVSIQSQILNLLLSLQEELALTVLFIAHDLAVVKHISDRIAVMYLGKIVEYADADELYRHPRHPYTMALISAIPVPDPTVKRKQTVLAGDVPSPIHPPPGCRFNTRCPYVIDRCRIEEPALVPILQAGGEEHLAACHRVDEIQGGEI